MSTRRQAGAVRSLARRAALALAVVTAAIPGARADATLVPIPLETLPGRTLGNTPVVLSARGLEIPVVGDAVVALPFPAQELEIEAAADGPVLLSWSGRSGSGFRPYGPPWRYVAVPREPAPLRLDLRIAWGWAPSARPVLYLLGTGTLVVRAMRARPVPRDPVAIAAALDGALLWAPESVGHTTINLLTRSYWSASRRTWLSDVVAGAALAVFLAALAVSWLRHRRFHPGLALALAGLVALAAWNAHFLVRFLPMANLRPQHDVEARIRDNYYFSPEFGALAALARATLRAGERVGVSGERGDWFAPQTLCFQLAPRPCVIVERGAEVHSGISRVGRLRSEELDAIVSFHGGPLPDGFETVAAVTPEAVVARRR
ncbi:MAG TPA: hypothetical protein VFL83_21475 [Anaeromyxobacter sp.]|nr:hypothetical protein [Anaeromyxobacter sp.]